MNAAFGLSSACSATGSWPEVPLDSVAVRGSGHTPDKKHPEYWGGNIKWVSLKDTSKLDKGVIDSTAETITATGIAHSSAVVHPAGSVILLRDAAIGKCAIVGDNMAVSQHFMAWSCGPAINNWFLYFLFESRRAEFERISNGSTIKTIGLGYFRQLKIRLPSPAVQDAISEMLRNADDLISALDRLIAKKQAIKQGMMQQLLTGKTRLPGFNGPWTPRRLSDMLSYEQPSPYLVQTSKQLESGLVPVLTAGKTFILGYTNESHGVYIAHPVIIFDDFTTASKYVDFKFKAKSSAMKILSPKVEADLRFVYERMQLIDFPLGDHKRYWISEYGKQEIDVPDKEEQEAISAVIVDADLELRVLHARLAKANAIKQGMMQELLTGRTRLPVKEAAS